MISTLLTKRIVTVPRPSCQFRQTITLHASFLTYSIRHTISEEHALIQTPERHL